MSEFKIEKGIPLPADRVTGVSDAAKKMNVGDSIKTTGEISKVRSGWYAAALRFGMKFTIRPTDDGAIRIRRIK